MTNEITAQLEFYMGILENLSGFYEKVDVVGKQRIIPEGFTVEPTVLPLKLLAVRSGLAEYGRNNICYIPGKGSFYRLMAIITLSQHYIILQAVF